jgi:hypothetical protein
VKKETRINKNEVKLPAGVFCGNNCADDCRYYEPRKKDKEGRGYCSHYDAYYYPSERDGCFSYKE